MTTHEDAARALARLLTLMDKLRDPGGCPWDREQDLKSLRPYLLEEAHEVLEAIDAADPAHHREELGDLLFQIVFQSRIAREQGWWAFADVANGISDKLERRHPHVFPDAAGEKRTVSGSAEVIRNWEQIKAKEKTERKSVLEGVPKALPALIRAERLTEKAAAVGFDWPDLSGARAKVTEELDELDAAIATGDRAQMEDELGDALFALSNVARFLKVHPEDALRAATAKFERRFGHIERELKARGKSPRESTLAEMDALWDEAKAAE